MAQAKQEWYEAQLKASDYCAGIKYRVDKMDWARQKYDAKLLSKLVIQYFCPFNDNSIQFLQYFW